MDTREGDVIEISGTMRGGGKPRRGGMSANQRGADDLTPEQILILENDLEFNKAKLKEIKEKQAIHKGIMSTSETSLKDIETKTNMMLIEIESLNKQLKEFENKLTALKELMSKKVGNDDSKQWVDSLKKDAKITAEQLDTLVNCK